LSSIARNWAVLADVDDKVKVLLARVRSKSPDGAEGKEAASSDMLLDSLH